MSSKIERIRQELIDAGSPMAKHSMNQRMLKKTAEGEHRLGIDKDHGQSRSKSELGEQKDGELFQIFFKLALELDNKNEPVQMRIGQFALKISSILSGVLKEDPQEFLSQVADAQVIDFPSGSQFEKLVPVEKMASSFIRDTGYPTIPESYQSARHHAHFFALNYGGILYSEGPEMTAIFAEVALTNIALYIANQINLGQVDVYHARRMITVFGETTNQHLGRWRPRRRPKLARRC